MDVIVGPAKAEFMIKETCGCCGCALATADAPSVAISPRRENSEMKDADEKLWETAMRTNEPVTKLRIIKSIAEKFTPCGFEL